ncbi:MAG TPA: CoB--CoM heterodisulfide reductase iron-sulfur subunit A family protein [Dehalococcoidia bacterium]|nr:CoB--CoM heterodisulfide reductase iron-sulfur subunit A family protein [Dehalococcoidia bacterium]
MQAALEVADAEHHVYLVEKSPTVGGRMLQLDKTFPTLDCASCIGTPKMSQVGSNRFINLMTYSEVDEISGHVGDFKVKIRKKARFVDEHKCTGCGVCQEKCPWRADSEWNLGLGKRKAIYTPFAQAVPNIPVIDKNVCAFLQTGKCRACEKFCPAGAIDFNQTDTIVEVEVGAIIVTTGFDLLDPTPMIQYGYGKFENVFTSLEVERLISSTGPTEGHVVLKDGSTPKGVAIIHCVGSRDENYHEYCSRVCCMYGLKHAHLIKEKTGADVYQMYIDMRCFGKGYEEFYKRISEEDVHFIRGKVAQVTDIAITDEEKDRLVVVCEDTLLGTLIRVPVDMVVLSIAMEPRTDADQIAKIFGLKQDKDGFFEEEHYKLDPMSTGTEGIFLAGCCQGPKDIPDTVAQAIGAAAKALALVARGEIGTRAEAEAVAVGGN